MINYFKGKSVLITGASGSIGSALLKNLIKTKSCKVIRAMSNDENGLFELNQELLNHTKKNKTKFDAFKNAMKRNRIRILYGDVRDYKRCVEASKKIDIIIHAAAVKHVPICQYNPKEAVKTNLLGTNNLCKAAIKNKVKKFLLISTDKVVNPTSIMGETKLKAEKIVLGFNRKATTKFACIRFGNVVGSRGSVIPLFINQIKNRKNITVTDKNMTRFFMLIESAVRLITESISLMRGNEIFILNSMKSFKVLDLAIVLKSIFKSKNKILLIGKKDGEKLSESLFTKKELKYLYDNKKLLVINRIYNEKKMIDFYKATKVIKKDIYNSDNKNFLMSKKSLKIFLKKII
jgi:UDP-N-acetylglucosamine 4,6-dehydratase/5-epimerase